jgi:HAD superfamily phosphatase (TIGR01668 family)
MLLYPELYVNNVTEITMKILKNNNIKGILLDVDNTLIDYDKKIFDGVKPWIEFVKGQKIQACILSNTNKIEKVKKVAEELGIPYISFAQKPLKKGFKKAQKLLGLDAYSIAVVGDQIFTDVIGANRMGMFSVLTKPVDKRDIFVTRIKRPLENFIIKMYLRKERRNECI